jgi:hypothetical protein
VVRNEHRLLKNHCGIFRAADTMLIHAANANEAKSPAAHDFFASGWRRFQAPAMTRMQVRFRMIPAALLGNGGAGSV